MPSERTTYRKLITAKLRDRKIVWVGTRGCDATPLTDIKNHIVSICYGSPAKHQGITEHTYEQMMNHRVNPYTYDSSLDSSAGIKELRRILIKELEEPSALIPYRPMELIDTAYFLNHEHTMLLGMFSEFQRAFNNRTWVETSLANSGMKTIPWDYRQFNEGTKQEIFRTVLETPVIIRINAAALGSGIVRIDSKDEFEAVWNWMSLQHSKLVAFSPFLPDASPLSASATVFEDGRVALHPISLQCLGAAELTPEHSGYSGNDFGMPKELPESAFNHFEAMIRDTGKWLRAHGYLGTFGVDALFHDGELYFLETNPRFQASSQMAAHVDEALHRPDVYMTHMAAYLGLPPPPQISLKELTGVQPQIGQMIIHNTHPHLVKVQTNEPSYQELPFSVMHTPKPSVSVAPGSPISTLNTNEPLLRPDGNFNATGTLMTERFLQAITLRPQGLLLSPPGYHLS